MNDSLAASAAVEKIGIDRKQLRQAIFGKFTRAFACYDIATRLLYRDHWGIEHREVVRVYGNRTKTVAVSWKEGYSDKETVLCRVPSTEEGYREALRAIEAYFSSD